MRSIVKRVALIAVTATMGVTVAAAPALAEVVKTSKTSCPFNEFVTIHVKGGGTLQTAYPVGVIKHTEYVGDHIFTFAYRTGKKSTSWQVTSTGYLSDQDTYGSCQPAP